MRLLTTETVDDAEIVRGDVVYACAISGANIVRDMREAITNTIGGRTGQNDEARWRAAEQEVRNAQAQWTRLGPVPPEVAGPLNERFQRACRRFYDQRRRAS